MPRPRAEEGREARLEEARLAFLEGLDVDVLRLEERPEGVRDVVMGEDVGGVAIQARRELAGVAQGGAEAVAADEVGRAERTQVETGYGSRPAGRPAARRTGAAGPAACPG